MKRLIIIVMTSLIIFLTSCSTNQEIPYNINYRQEMRDFVQGISTYAKETNPSFVVIPQNGHELLTEDGEYTGITSLEYINAIDGIGREDLFYGYNNDDEATPELERSEMVGFMNVAVNQGLRVLVTDYCQTHSFMDDSYNLNTGRNYISFAADSRELDNIPMYPINPINVNDFNVTSLPEVNNFLYLLNPGSYSSKDTFLSAVQNTNYDLIIIDLFYDGDFELTKSDVESLKIKANGGSRLVVSYMSIGEAEDYRYYWNNIWAKNAPSWLDEENTNWSGNYKVRYWEKSWQSIIFGNNDSYLKMILDAGFDGVYLDIIDAYEYFED